MKKRALIGALCCLSTASATAVAAPVSTAQIAAPTALNSQKSMADQYQPVFPKPHAAFGINGDNTSERLFVDGVPAETKFSILDSNFPDGGNNKNGLLVTVEDNDIWLQIFPDGTLYEKTVSNTVDIAVEYPDGSTEVVTHTFTVQTAEKYQHNPTFDKTIIQVGETTTLKISDVPSDASVTSFKVPQDWNVNQEGSAFTVAPPVEGNGKFSYKVTFSDGTSKVITNDVEVVRLGSKGSNPPSPAESGSPVAPGDDSDVEQGWVVGPSDPGNSGGSSTTGIIAGVIGAVLAIALSIGGAAFAGLIPGLKLPF